MDTDTVTRTITATQQVIRVTGNIEKKDTKG
jgi:hypothetical protein